MLKALCGVVFSILSGFVVVSQAYAAPQNKPVSQTAKKSGKKTTATKGKAKAAAPAKSKRKVKAGTTSKRQAKTASRGKHRGAANRQAKAPAARGRLVKKVVVVNGRRKVVHRRVAVRSEPAVASVGDMAGLNRTRDPLELKSNVALVFDQGNARVLLAKNADVAL